MKDLFAQINFLFGRLAFLRLFIILMFTPIFCVVALSDTETDKQTENSASLSRDNSAHLARVLQLRQSRDQIGHRKRDEKSANVKTNNGKPKRYKCFLVDDNESEENLAQQKSYFAKFQDRQRRPTDILGWEESPRRSAGAAAGPRYLYLSTKGTTSEPIIEYIDEDNGNEAETVGTTVPLGDMAEYSIAAQRTTMRAMALKQQLSMQTATTATSPVMRPKTSDEKQQEEDYVEEIGDDLYIATTTHKLIQQEQTMPTATNKAQGKMPRARSIPGGALFDDDTNKITEEKPAEDSAKQFVPNVKIKASMKPFNMPITPTPLIKIQKAKEITEENNKMTMERMAEETEKQQQNQSEQQQQQLIRITPLRKGTTTDQQTETKQQQKQLQADNDEQQQMMAQNVQRDLQGRPLILSPEHCKMVEHYSGLYGVKDVPSFVHNNCVFAKMYLPTATCAEIDILIASCYQPRNDRQQKQKRGKQ